MVTNIELESRFKVFFSRFQGYSQDYKGTKEDFELIMYGLKRENQPYDSPQIKEQDEHEVDHGKVRTKEDIDIITIEITKGKDEHEVDHGNVKIKKDINYFCAKGTLPPSCSCLRFHIACFVNAFASSLCT
nr:hypothetical protein CFP56_27625 [Quercus suber]